MIIGAILSTRTSGRHTEALQGFECDTDSVQKSFESFKPPANGSRSLASTNGDVQLDWVFPWPSMFDLGCQNRLAVRMREVLRWSESSGTLMVPRQLRNFCCAAGISFYQQFYAIKTLTSSSFIRHGQSAYI